MHSSNFYLPDACKCKAAMSMCGIPGWGTQVQRGAAPALRISRKTGSFLRPPHVRDFVKEGYFFVPMDEVWGVKIPLQSTKYMPEYTRL